MADAAVPGARNLLSDDLSGDMIIALATSGPMSAQSTLDELSDFFREDSLSNIISTPITTVGNGTLTAAAMVGGLIVRSGSIAAYTDTTDTAANIISALGDAPVVGTSWLLYIKNLAAFSQTLSAGAGLTLSGNKNVVPANSAGLYLMSYSAAGAVTMQGIWVVALNDSLPLSVTALTTVGAGTITGAGVAAGITTRGGAQSGSAFTDTSDTADNIVAAIPNARIGVAFLYTYRNNTDAQATLAGGTGVTLSQIVPKNTWATFLVTYTAASTIVFAIVYSGSCVPLPASKLTVGTGATAAAGDLTGAAVTNYENNASNATYTTRTAAQMFGDLPNCQVGIEYQLAIRNLNATGMTLTAADGSVTLSGTMSIAQNVTRTFNVKFTSATAVTITSMGISAAAA